MVTTDDIIRWTKDHSLSLLILKMLKQCWGNNEEIQIFKDEKGSYHGCAKAKDGRVPCMPPICKLKERK